MTLIILKNFRGIFHLMGYLCSIFGSWMVGGNSVFNSDYLLLLLLLNFFLANWFYKRNGIEKDVEEAIREIEKKNRNSSDE